MYVLYVIIILHVCLYIPLPFPPSCCRTNNPVILQLLLSLTHSLTDPLAQELVTRSMASCPDLLLSYLKSLGLSLEPRPTSRWIQNMDLLSKVWGIYS